jgi:hypothetical protein
LADGFTVSVVTTGKTSDHLTESAVGEREFDVLNVTLLLEPLGGRQAVDSLHLVVVLPCGDRTDILSTLQHENIESVVTAYVGCVVPRRSRLM